VARGDSKQFFWNELFVNIYSLAFMIIGYYLYGFTGMGIAFACNYVFYTIQMYIFAKIRFNFRFNSDFIKIVIPQVIICIVIFIIILIIGEVKYKYLIGIFLSLIMMLLSIKYFNKIIHLSEVFDQIKNIIDLKRKK
jgi:O-antigen/teichoic acid export membrane protein